MNNNSLRKGRHLLGTQFIAYGLSDEWLIGASPFVFAQFSAMNLGSRRVWSLDAKRRLGAEFSWVKTYGAEDPQEKLREQSCRENWFPSACDRRVKYPTGFLSFKMEAWIGKLALSHAVNSRYQLSLQPSIFYYVNDERPFSFRMDPQNSDPYALNFTTLHEYQLSRSRVGTLAFLNFEGGVWGLNYTYPYLHLGTSIHVQTQRFLLGAGASTTISPGLPYRKAAKFMNYDSRMSVHPEIQVGAYF